MSEDEFMVNKLVDEDAILRSDSPDGVGRESARSGSAHSDGGRVSRSPSADIKHRHSSSKSPSRSRSHSRSRHRGARRRSNSSSRHRRRRSYSRSCSRSPRRRYHGRRNRSYSRSRSRSRSYSPYSSRRRHSHRGHSRSRSRSPLSNRRRHQGNRFNPNPCCVLGVFGLSLYTSEKDLREIFGRYGALQHVNIVYDHLTGRSRGFGFVYFEDSEDAADAKEHCNSLELDGRRIRVDYSITKRAHTPTPGVYMGRPTNPSRDGKGDDSSDERGRNDSRSDHNDSRSDRYDSRSDRYDSRSDRYDSRSDRHDRDRGRDRDYGRGGNSGYLDD